MSKKLHYFNTNALGEGLRYILHYTKQDFEDIRHELHTWTNEHKSKFPFGMLPIYEEEGRVLTQSMAIAKYIVRNTDLLPIDPWEKAVLESVAYTIYDFWLKVVPYILEKDPQKKQELKQKLVEETIDYFFSRFNKQLEENGGYFGKKLSWVEFILCGIVEATNLFLGTEIEKKYPEIEAVMKKIWNLPGVKEYIAKRPSYT